MKLEFIFFKYSQHVSRQGFVDQVNEASSFSREQISADKYGQNRDHQLVHSHVPGSVGARSVAMDRLWSREL